jgi:hypothetical protein
MRFVLIAVLAMTACTPHDVHVKYPAAPGAPTGQLVLLLSQPASGVSVSIGGLLVVEDQRTKKVVVDNVPVGTAEVAICANGADKQLRPWIDDTHPTTVPLGVPDASTGFLKALIGTLVTIAVYSLLR